MKILIISPYFFPDKTVGMFRMTTLADYLSMNNEEVTVIRNENSIVYEKSPYKYLDRVKEVRVKLEEGSKFLNSSKKYKQVIINYCKNNKVDKIVYTCGPYYSMFIAADVYKENKIPYIMDIRDFWVKNLRGSTISKIKQNIVSVVKWYIENKAFKYSEKIVVVTEGMKKVYSKYFPKYRGKIALIYNGYDDQRKKNLDNSNFVGSLDLEKNNVNICCCGKMVEYSKFHVEKLLLAINRLLEDGISAKLYHIGSEEKDIYRIIESKNLNEDIYLNLGYRENDLCIEILKNMDVNIIIYLDKYGLGSKLFDYLFVEKPILYIGEDETEMSEFLIKNNSFVAGSVEEIVSAVKLIYNKKISGSNDVERIDNNSKYTRMNQNRHYYNLIKS